MHGRVVASNRVATARWLAVFRTSSACRGLWSGILKHVPPAEPGLPEHGSPKRWACQSAGLGKARGFPKRRPYQTLGWLGRLPRGRLEAVRRETSHGNARLAVSDECRQRSAASGRRKKARTRLLANVAFVSGWRGGGVSVGSMTSDDQPPTGSPITVRSRRDTCAGG